MDALVITWRELLIAFLLASLIYLLEVAVFSRRRRARAETAADPTLAEIARLRDELAVLRQRLDTVESRLAAVAAESREEDTPYSRAVRLVREGLTAQELASRCGISRAEAELIIALNRAKP